MPLIQRLRIRDPQLGEPTLKKILKYVSLVRALLSFVLWCLAPHLAILPCPVCTYLVDNSKSQQEEFFRDSDRSLSCQRLANF